MSVKNLMDRISDTAKAETDEKNSKPKAAFVPTYSIIETLSADVGTLTVRVAIEASSHYERRFSVFTVPPNGDRPSRLPVRTGEEIECLKHLLGLAAEKIAAYQAEDKAKSEERAAKREQRAPFGGNTAPKQPQGLRGLGKTAKKREKERARTAPAEG